jgi:hypothetical protein
MELVLWKQIAVYAQGMPAVVCTYVRQQLGGGLYGPAIYGGAHARREEDGFGHLKRRMLVVERL